MSCCYCGKVIGAIRLLRDSEFCSDLHRTKFGERLGKALHEIAAPEPAPAGVAGFLDQMPLQQGNVSRTLNLWHTVTGRNRIRNSAYWGFTIDTSDATPIAEFAPGEFPPRSERWMPAPAPEPVAALVQASAALTPVRTLRAHRFAAALELTPVLDKAPHSPARCDIWMPVPAPEPVAAFVQASATLALSHRLCMPRFAAELEPLPVPDEPLAPPEMCRKWIPAPAADPVFSYVHTSIAPAVAAPLALVAPAFDLCATAPDVPWIALVKPMPGAEAVMTTVLPSAAKVPLAPIRQAAAIALPAIPQIAREPFAATASACTPQPEPVERLLVAAHSAVPVSMERAPCRALELGALPAVRRPAPEIGQPVASPAPAALESVLVASVAAPMARAIAVRLQPFKLAASPEHTLPSFDAQRLTPAASRPAAAAPRLKAPHPIATLAVTPPATTRRPPESALPHPGLLSIEFRSHRLRSAAAARPEWIHSLPALLPPRFLLGPILERLEEPAPRQKSARQETGFVGLLKMPSAKRPPSVWMVAGRIAAGFLLAASLWFGVANFRGDHRLAAREEVSSGDTALSAANNASSAGISNGGTPAQPAPKGPVAWVRHAIASRAALRIGDDFRGMENWDSAARTRPAGWSRNPDGYVNAGALALFRPSLKFTDYRMEFFGQIETKSIDWTVRATDTMNYHAMKLTVVEAGMRPFVALVHYNVVGGKSGHRTETPLNVMVHNNTPMQFAVDVRGNRVVTSIDGEEVDSFIDNTLVAGGVGFFSEAGERSRLYWMRVSRNDDWLGHVCAMLADGASVGSTAGLRGPELPGGAPAPGLPAGGDGMTLAAMWIGLPYLGAARKTRFSKTWRSEPWNT